MSSTMCFTSKGHSTRIAPPLLEKSAGDTKRFELRILFAGLLFVLLFGLFAVPVAAEDDLSPKLRVLSIEDRLLTSIDGNTIFLNSPIIFAVDIPANADIKVNQDRYPEEDLVIDITGTGNGLDSHTFSLYVSDTVGTTEYIEYFFSSSDFPNGEYNVKVKYQKADGTIGYSNTVSFTVSSEQDIALSGLGTENNPYLIQSPADLKLLSDEVKSGKTFADTYFAITDNLDLSFYTAWQPIGDMLLGFDLTDTESPYDGIVYSAYSQNIFCGIVDGRGNTISHLTTDNTHGGGTWDFNGLFGVVGPGTVIKNLQLIDIDVSSGGYRYTGGLIGGIYGYHDYGSETIIIENCHVDGEIEGNGGLIGRAYSEAAPIIISKCSARVSGVLNVDGGGLIGEIDAYPSSAEISVSECSVYLNDGVIVDAGFVSSVSAVDGTILIKDCYVLGKGSINTGAGLFNTVTADSESIVTIENCYSDVTVSTGTYVGGLIGSWNAVNKYLESTSQTPGILTVKNSVYLGEKINGDYANKIAGYNGEETSEITKSDLYAIDNVELTSYSPNEYGYEGLTVSSSNAVTQAFYEYTLGWDFDTVWKMDSSVSPYPILQQISTPEPVDEYTITFDADGGTGSMTSATVSAGDSYTLPDCTFTAPEGQVFKAWLIGSTEYAAGTSYTPTASVTVKAVWTTEDTTAPGIFTINPLENGVVSWTASEGATGYKLSLRDRTISETEDTGKKVNNEDVETATNYDISSYLVEGHSYRVAVCAYNDAGKETWAELEFVFGNCQHNNLADVDITYNGITKDFPQDSGDGTHYWYVNVVCDDCKEVQQENVKRNAEHNANTLEKNGVCECNYHRYETGLSYTMYAIEDANTYLAPEENDGYHGGSISKDEEVTVLAEGLGSDGSWSLIQYSVTGTSREKVRFVKSESLDAISISFTSCLDGTKSSSYNVCYSESYFAGDSRIYNHKLAQVSLGLAASSYTAPGLEYTAEIPRSESADKQRYANIDDAYQKLGFTNVKYYNYDVPLSDTSDKVAYSIAKKETRIGGKDTVIFVIVPRSGAYGGEWISNFNIGNGPYSEGFYEPAIMILETFKKELATVSDSAEVKVWTTGFSRGAAVSNLFAGELTRNAESLGLKQENIYAYTFATPQGVDTTYDINRDVHTDYTNIINIVNPSDVVPTVPMTTWGFDRYGVTYYFDYDAAKSSYKTYSISQQYEIITGSNYIPENLESLIADISIHISDSFESKSIYLDTHSIYIKDILSLLFYEKDIDINKLIDFPSSLLLLYPADDFATAYYKVSNHDSSYLDDEDIYVYSKLANGLKLLPDTTIDLWGDPNELRENMNKLVESSRTVTNIVLDGQLLTIAEKITDVRDGIITIGVLNGKSVDSGIAEIHLFLDVFSYICTLYENGYDLSNVGMQHYHEVYMAWMSTATSNDDLFTDSNVSYLRLLNSAIDVFVVADGEGIVSGSQRTLPNTKVLISAVPDYGYEFVGWYDESGSLISTDEQYMVFVGSPESTFTAKFQHGYTIEYDLNGGTNDLNNPSRYYITDDDIRLNNPTKSFSGNGQYGRYIFLGWTWEGQDKPIKDVVIEAGSSGRKTYTANWGGYIAHPIDNEVTTPDMEIHKIILPTNLGSDYHVEIIPIPSTTLAPAQTQTGTFNPLKGYDINPSQQMRPGSTVTIEFYLETTDLPDFVNPTAVALYHKEGNTWTKLPTTYLHTVSGKHWYSAQTTGFSPFVIGYDVSTSSLPDTDDTSGSSKDTGSGNYVEYPRTVTNGGYVDFGTSPVVKGVTLPEGVSGKVVLIAKSETPAPEGKEAYGVFEIKVDAYPAGEKAVISFTIPLSDLQKKGCTEKDICLYHFDGEVWTKLLTTYTVEGDKVFYEAETTAFSPFAIVYEKDGATSAAVSEIPVEPENPSDEPVSTVPEIPSSSEPQETESPAPVLGMMLGGLGAAVLMRRK